MPMLREHFCDDRIIQAGMRRRRRRRSVRQASPGSQACVDVTPCFFIIRHGDFFGLVVFTGFTGRWTIRHCWKREPFLANRARR